MSKSATAPGGADPVPSPCPIHKLCDTVERMAAEVAAEWERAEWPTKAEWESRQKAREPIIEELENAEKDAAVGAAVQLGGWTVAEAERRFDDLFGVIGAPGVFPRIVRWAPRAYTNGAGPRPDGDLPYLYADTIPHGGLNPDEAALLADPNTTEYARDCLTAVRDRRAAELREWRPCDLADLAALRADLAAKLRHTRRLSPTRAAQPVREAGTSQDGELEREEPTAPAAPLDQRFPALSPAGLLTYGGKSVSVRGMAYPLLRRMLEETHLGEKGAVPETALIADEYDRTPSSLKSHYAAANRVVKAVECPLRLRRVTVGGQVHFWWDDAKNSEETP